MKTFLLFFLFSSSAAFAQSEKKSLFPISAVGIQYAGSVGMLSAGYFRQAANKKIVLGILYGYTPAFAGGEVHSLSLKFIYEPFTIKTNSNIQIEPLQTGIFIAQNFAKNLSLTWSDKYEEDYYWWTNSMRFHIFLGAQASYVIKDHFVKKISFYCESNTNDLYILSYAGNHNLKSVDFADIIFFGIGSKVYF